MKVHYCDLCDRLTNYEHEGTHNYCAWCYFQFWGTKRKFFEGTFTRYFIIDQYDEVNFLATMVALT